MLEELFGLSDLVERAREVRLRVVLGVAENEVPNVGIRILLDHLLGELPRLDEVL